MALAVPRGTKVSLDDIQRNAMRRLALPALPQVLVVVPALPRTNGTGKLQRVGYAEKLGLPMIADLEKYTYHVEENGALRRVR